MLTTSSLPNSMVNTAYSLTLTAGGRSRGNPYTTLFRSTPAGLSLSAAGVISGTPTASGNSSFTVQVKDSANSTATKALTIAIYPAALVVTTTSLPNGTVNTAYSQTLTAGGGSGGNQWTF